MGEEQYILQLVRQQAYNINPRLAISQDGYDYVLAYVQPSSIFATPSIEILLKSNLERITGFLIGYNYLKSKIPF